MTLFTHFKIYKINITQLRPNKLLQYKYQLKKAVIQSHPLIRKALWGNNKSSLKKTIQAILATYNPLRRKKTPETILKKFQVNIFKNKSDSHSDKNHLKSKNTIQYSIIMNKDTCRTIILQLIKILTLRINKINLILQKHNLVLQQEEENRE